MDRSRLASRRCQRGRAFRRVLAWPSGGAEQRPPQEGAGMQEKVRLAGMTRSRATASAVLAVTATLAIAACGGNSGAKSAAVGASGGTLTYGLSQAPDSLNPAKGVY